MQPGTVLCDRYRLEKLLGRGGMGSVWRAEHLGLRAPVAVKLIDRALALDPDALARFHREAHAAATIRSPHVVQVLDHGVDDASNTPFIVMELLEGETLGARLAREKTLSPERTAALIGDVCHALARAHPAGIVHRDLKPDNVFLVQDEHEFAKVLDFGVAKSQPAPLGAGESTRTGSLLGTPYYMSPEQIGGSKQIDARSDLWSVAVMACQCITGRRPFEADSVVALAVAICSRPIPLASTLGPCSTAFEAWLVRALERDPAKRFQTARELSDALKQACAAPDAVTPIEPVFSGTLGAETLAAGQGGDADATTPHEGGSDSLSHFVGRGVELEQLRRLFRRADAGQGGMVLLIGDAGMGKTLLVQQFLAQLRQTARRCLIAAGRGLEQYGTGEAFLPFIDALADLLKGAERARVAAVLRARAPTWLRAFPGVFSLEPDALPAPGSTSTDRQGLLRELADALELLAKEHGLLLILEDLHWADASSVDLLRFVSQRAVGQRLLVLGTLRPADAARDNPALYSLMREARAADQSEELTLVPLTASEIRAYLDRRFVPNDLPHELDATLLAKTGGLPLFATRLLRLLRERGDLVRSHETWGLARPLTELKLEVPASVQGLIRGRLESLSEDERRTLDCASVLGAEFECGILSELLGEAELEVEERLLGLARVHRLVESIGELELPDGSSTSRYRFAHSLYENVLYEELGPKKKTLLHSRAGAALSNFHAEEAPRFAVQLALHFERGRDFGRAVEYLIAAADSADRLHANLEAEQLYSRAFGLIQKLRHADQPAARMIIRFRRGWLFQRLRRHEDTLSEFSMMLAEAQALRRAEPSDLLDKAFSYVERPWRDAFSPHAAPLLPKGSRAMGAAAFECEAHRALAFRHGYLEQLAQAQDQIEAILGLVESSGHDAWRAEALAQLGSLCERRGNPDAALTHLEGSVALSRRHQDRRSLRVGLAFRAHLRLCRSLFQGAELDYVEALSLASDVPSAQAYTAELGFARAKLGQVSKALEDFASAAELGQHSNFYGFVAGWLWRELGRSDLAVGYDQASVELSRNKRRAEYELVSLVQLGLDHAQTGLAQTAWECLHAAEALQSRRSEWSVWCSFPHVATLRAVLLLQEGQNAVAEVCAQHALAAASSQASREHVAEAHRHLAGARGSLGDLAGAREQLELGLRAIGDLRMPFVAWKLHAALGRISTSLEDAAQAQRSFARAHAIILDIAENTEDERLRSSFLGLPEVEVALRATSSRA